MSRTSLGSLRMEVDAASSGRYSVNISQVLLQHLLRDRTSDAERF